MQHFFIVFFLFLGTLLLGACRRNLAFDPLVYEAQPREDKSPRVKDIQLRAHQPRGQIALNPELRQLIFPPCKGAQATVVLDITSNDWYLSGDEATKKYFTFVKNPDNTITINTKTVPPDVVAQVLRLMQKVADVDVPVYAISLKQNPAFIDSCTVKDAFNNGNMTSIKKTAANAQAKKPPALPCFVKDERLVVSAYKIDTLTLDSEGTVKKPVILEIELKGGMVKPSNGDNPVCYQEESTERMTKMTDLSVYPDGDALWSAVTYAPNEWLTIKGIKDKNAATAGATGGSAFVLGSKDIKYIQVFADMNTQAAYRTNATIEIRKGTSSDSKIIYQINVYQKGSSPQP